MEYECFKGTYNQVLEFCKKNLPFNNEMIEEWNKIGFDIDTKNGLYYEFDETFTLELNKINNSYFQFILSYDYCHDELLDKTF